MTAGALSHLRLVELGSGFASAYTAKLLADLGADVVKIEPPGGDATRKLGPFPAGRVDPETSGMFLYLNANKRGIVLDLGAAADLARFRKLLDRADVLIHDIAPAELSRYGLEPQEVIRGRPRLVATAIAPFGLRGPYRDYRAYDLNLWNAGGIASLNGGGPGTDDLPPLRTFGYQSTFQVGLNAAVASLGAIFARETSGVGQHVEVSAQEALVTILELTYPFWPYCQMVASRLGNKPIQPLDFFECRDGWVFLCAVEEHQWKTFVEIMGSPEWAALDIFADRLQRAANWDALKPMIASWMAEQTVQELYQLLQRRRVPIAPVSTMGDLWSSKHLNARGFFVSFTHPRAGARRTPGAPYLLSRTPWTLRRAAPLLGEHTAEVLRELA
jgi:crotonobetainyl-CoA:carnitine CoA-transferase CaiB-like acyl-CoA transferase